LAKRQTSKELDAQLRKVTPPKLEVCRETLSEVYRQKADQAEEIARHLRVERNLLAAYSCNSRYPNNRTAVDISARYRGISPQAERESRTRKPTYHFLTL